MLAVSLKVFSMLLNTPQVGRPLSFRPNAASVECYTTTLPYRSSFLGAEENNTFQEHYYLTDAPLEIFRTTNMQ